MNHVHLKQEPTFFVSSPSLPHATQITVTLHVTDLHSVTPDSFLEMAGGSLNALSYQQARNNNAVVGQVYVADPGDMLVSMFWLMV